MDKQNDPPTSSLLPYRQRTRPAMVSNSVPHIPRPQMIRCICGFPSHDGLAISCDKCGRWCHAACFEIEDPAGIPDIWRCWVCHPRSGISKGKAVGLQMARHARAEEELRNKQLDEIAHIPEFESLVNLVKDTYPYLKTVKVYEVECKNLVDRCTPLLLAVSSGPSDEVSKPTLEVSNLLCQINDNTKRWAGFPFVQSVVQMRQIKETIDRLIIEADRLTAAFRLRRRGMFNPINSPRSEEAIAAVGLELDTSSNIQPVGSGPEKIIVWKLTDTEPPQSPELHPLPDSKESSSEIYMHLSGVLCQVILASPGHERFYQTFQIISRELAQLDPILALARSHSYRTQLLELCRDIEIADSPVVRQAVQKDEESIYSLQELLSTYERSREVVLGLHGDDAEGFMDLIQTALDRYKNEDPKFLGSAHRLLVKLSERSGILPTSLSIQGVMLLEREAVFGGGFADIYRASHDGREVALKRMRVFQRGQERNRIHRTFCKEALLWQRLRHPHVLPFLGVDSETFSPYLCMVSPWMKHGTIMRYLSENESANVHKLITEIAQGLAYLHLQGVVHGDLRGGNILINDEWQACLADFGLTVVSEATLATRTSNSHGSTRWMSPELHDPESFNLERFLRTPASDIYAFACVCLEIYTGRSPFADTLNDTTVMLQVVRGVRPKRPPSDVKRCISDDMWGLVERCWRQEPAQRLSIREIIPVLADCNA